MTDRTYDPFIMRSLVDNAAIALASLSDYAVEVLPSWSSMRIGIEQAKNNMFDHQLLLATNPYSDEVGVEDPAATTREEALAWAIRNAIGDLESFHPEDLDLTDDKRAALAETLKILQNES